MTAAIAHRPTATVPPGYPAALTGAVPAMRAAKLKSSDTLSQGAITAPWLSDLASPKRAAADPGVADLWRRETREPYDRDPGYYVVRRNRLGAASWASCAGHCKARTNPLAGISAYLNEVEIEERSARLRSGAPATQAGVDWHSQSKSANGGDYGAPIARCERVSEPQTNHNQ